MLLSALCKKDVEENTLQRDGKDNGERLRQPTLPYVTPDAILRRASGNIMVMMMMLCFVFLVLLFARICSDGHKMDSVLSTLTWLRGARSVETHGNVSLSS